MTVSHRDCPVVLCLIYTKFFIETEISQETLKSHPESKSQTTQVSRSPSNYQNHFPLEVDECHAHFPPPSLFDYFPSLGIHTRPLPVHPTYIRLYDRTLVVMIFFECLPPLSFKLLPSTNRFVNLNVDTGPTTSTRGRFRRPKGLDFTLALDLKRIVTDGFSYESQCSLSFGLI